MFAPTLLDIAHQLNVGVGLMSVIFLVRAIGGVLGTVGCGVIMDRLPQLHHSLLCLALAGLATGVHCMSYAQRAPVVLLWNFYACVCVCVCGQTYHYEDPKYALNA